MAAPAQHQVLPHGPPEALAANLWQVRGSLPFPLRRNMTVYRLPDGGLLLHSVVAMDEAGMKALEALGRPALLVIPHAGHMRDAVFYRQRYPELRVACPAEGRRRAEQRLKVDGTPEELLRPLGIKVHPVTGMRMGELALEVEVPGGKALIMNDTLAGPTPGETVPLFLRLTGPPRGPALGVPRIVRLTMVKDKVAVRAWLHLMAEIPDLKLVTVAHGPPLTADCAQGLRDGAATL